jgi:hypothetical protein
MGKTQKEVIVVQNREGCFLQTLNLGCLILVIMFGISVVLVIIGSAM